ncbi:MAG: OmpA family protein, partial [bacterium]|nr:OmpA family protein [bacterium]
NAGDAELWGNRGLVYSQYTPPKPPVEDPVDPPPPPPPPNVLHKKTVFNDVLFDFDKSNIRATEIPTIDHVIAELKKYKDDTVVIMGHTCDVGSEAYNKALGQRRADAVKKYLIEHGIDAGRITAKSCGEGKPAVANDTPANRKLNRRGVFVIDIKTYVKQ